MDRSRWWTDPDRLRDLAQRHAWNRDLDDQTAPPSAPAAHHAAPPSALTAPAIDGPDPWSRLDELLRWARDACGLLQAVIVTSQGQTLASLGADQIEPALIEQVDGFLGEVDRACASAPHGHLALRLGDRSIVIVWQERLRRRFFLVLAGPARPRLDALAEIEQALAEALR